MAKKHKDVVKPAIAPAPSPEPALTEPSIWENPWVATGLLAAAVVAVYAPSISNGFVFFDDDKAILYNQTLQHPSLGRFFSGQNLGMYAPFSWIAYYVGSLLSKQDAWGYHLLGMVLHAGNAVMAYMLLRQLLQRHWPAFFAAALFALHPVQTEAVSWAAALSTVLFSSFYLAGLLAYLQWKRATTPLYYALTLAAFLAALLSKSAAVTFPLVLLLIDFFESKKLLGKFWLSKSPFFLLSLAFGLYTFVTREQEGHDIAAASSVFSALDRFWMVGQTLLFYPVKLLVPLGFSVSYPFVKVGGAWDWTYYAAPLALLALAWVVWKYARTQYEVLLGLGLYVLPLTVMLPFRTVGSFELRSDRYVYLSCLGLFVLAALFLERQKQDIRQAVLGVAAILLAFLAFQQTKVWKDGIALFENCVQKTPESALCQCNLAYSELLDLDFKNADYHYSEALKYDPNTVEAYNGRGQARLQLRQIPEALSDFSNAIQAGIVTPKLFLNRGKCLVMLNRPQEALPDLNKSLELEPKAPETWFFRAVVFEKANEPDKALQDYSKAVELKPDYLEAIVNRAMIQISRQRYPEAIEDLSKALKINPNMEMLHNNRAYAHMKNGQLDQAMADANQALALNPKYPKAYQTRAFIYQQLGQMDKMQADMQMAQRLQQGH